MTVKELREALVGIEDNLVVWMDTDCHGIATPDKVGVGMCNGESAIIASEEDIKERIENHYGYSSPPERCCVLYGS